MHTPTDPADAAARFFVAQSRRYKGALSPQRLALWADAEYWRGRPLPAERPGLVLSPEGLRLHSPGQPLALWHPGFGALRAQQGRADPLLRALDLREGEVVLDGSFGMGYDARQLAHFGAQVCALERVPALAIYSLWGLARHDPEAARRIRLRCVDHRDWLAQAPSAHVDHVYLDPMFPAEHTGTGPNLSPLRALPLAPRVQLPTLRAALRVARRRVVLKLAPHEAPPELPEGPAPRLYFSRRQRFAVWSAEAWPTDEAPL